MRFAREHAPDAPPRSFWLRAGIFFLLLAVPVVIFNLAVDPFDFRLTPHAPLVREAIMRKNDTMLWSAGELRRIPQSALDEVTLVTVGDSRTEVISGGMSFPRVFKLGADHVLSLAVGGASFDESIKLLEAELPRLPKLRGVVLAIPLERIGVIEQDRAADALQTASFPMSYALSLGTAAYSIELLKAQANGQPNPMRAALDPEHLIDVSASWLDVPGNIAKANACVSRPMGKREKRVAKRWRKDLVHADESLIERRLREIVEPLAARLRERNVKLVFFFPPLHFAVLKDLDPKTLAMQNRYLISLSRLGVVEDFSRGDRSGIPVKFGDASHVLPEVANAIMGDIYLRNFAAPLPVASSDN